MNLLEEYKPYNLEISLFYSEIQERLSIYPEKEQQALILSVYILDVFFNTKDLKFLDEHESANIIKERLADLREIFKEQGVKNKICDVITSFLNTQSKSIIESFQETDKTLDYIFDLKSFKKIPKSIGRNSGGYLKKDDVLFLNDMFGDEP